MQKNGEQNSLVNDEGRKFAKYVSLNILAMLGSSCYVLADTFFVANGVGADGLTALNLAISMFSYIQAIGLMIGMGSATRFAVGVSRGSSGGNVVFTTALMTGLGAGLIIAAAGNAFCAQIAAFLGADDATGAMTSVYLRVIMGFAPFYLVNHTVVTFVRNDGNPKLATVALLTSNFSNIVLDYVFIYIFDWSMFGAAFATGIAPVVSLLCLSFHFFKKRNRFRLIRVRYSLRVAGDFCRLGISSLVNELSVGVVVMVFNYLFLGLGGNTAVAAYGIVANLALFAVAVFTGVAQGIQPLVSDSYGRGQWRYLRRILRDAAVVALFLAAVIVCVIFVFGDAAVALFNEAGDPQLQKIAEEGVRIYFLGFLPGGLNIVAAGYLSAMEKAEKGFLISLMRGLAVIAPAAFILSRLLGMNGVWIAVPFTETITFAAAAFLVCRVCRHMEQA